MYVPNLEWVIFDYTERGIGATKGFEYLQMLIRSSLVSEDMVFDDLFEGLCFWVKIESFMEEMRAVFW